MHLTFFLVLGFDRIPLYGVLILSIGGGILAAVLVHFIISPYLKKKIIREVYGNDDESDRRPSVAPAARGVSFRSKSSTVSEPQVNVDDQDLSGRYINPFTHNNTQGKVVL